MECSYLSLLDDACLFELLVRLHYEDLVNMCRTYNSLYKITCNTYFQESWNEYNITIQVITGPRGEVVCHKPVDRLNKIHGTRLDYDDGKLYEQIEYIQDLIQGRIIYGAYYDKYEPHVNDLRHGVTVYQYDSGNKHYFPYVNGVFHGLQRAYCIGGECFIQELNGGDRHGLYFAWHENGARYRRVRYVRGHESGKCVEWYNSGVKQSEYYYKNGVFHGSFKAWNSNGEVTMDSQYVDGKLVPNLQPNK